MAVAKITIQTTILVGAGNQAAAVAGVKKHLPELRQLLSYGMEDMGEADVAVFEITGQETLTGDALDHEIDCRELPEDKYDLYRDDVVVE